LSGEKGIEDEVIVAVKQAVLGVGLVFLLGRNNGQSLLISSRAKINLG
jgi:hypothetical protein